MSQEAFDEVHSERGKQLPVVVDLVPSEVQRAYEKLIRHDIANDMELRSGVVSQLQSRQKRLLAAFEAALERHPAVGEAMFAHVAQGAFYWFPNIQGVLDACAGSPKVTSAATVRNSRYGSCASVTGVSCSQSGVRLNGGKCVRVRVSQS